MSPLALALACLIKDSVPDEEADKDLRLRFRVQVRVSSEVKGGGAKADTAPLWVCDRAVRPLTREGARCYVLNHASFKNNVTFRDFNVCFRLTWQGDLGEDGPRGEKGDKVRRSHAHAREK